MSTVEHNEVRHPSHYNTGRIKHFKGCGQPVEVIDVTRQLPGGLANVIKYVLRAGYKDNEIQDLEKAAEYLRDWTAFRRAELGAEQETHAITGSGIETSLVPEPGPGSIAGGWTCPRCLSHSSIGFSSPPCDNCEKFYGRETAGHSMELDRIQDEQGGPRAWPGLLRVDYEPTGPDDPWKGMHWLETACGDEMVSDLLHRVIQELGIGNPDGWELRIAGAELPMAPWDRVGRLLGYGESLTLTRIQPKAPAQPYVQLDGDCGGEGQCCLDSRCSRYDQCAKNATAADLGLSIPAIEVPFSPVANPDRTALR